MEESFLSGLQAHPHNDNWNADWILNSETTSSTTEDLALPEGNGTHNICNFTFPAQVDGTPNNQFGLYAHSAMYGNPNAIVSGADYGHSPALGHTESHTSSRPSLMQRRLSHTNWSNNFTPELARLTHNIPTPSLTLGHDTNFTHNHVNPSFPSHFDASTMPPFFDSAQLAREQARYQFQTKADEDVSTSTRPDAKLVDGYDYNNNNTSSSSLSDADDAGSDSDYSDGDKKSHISSKKNNPRKRSSKKSTVRDDDSEDEDYLPAAPVNDSYGVFPAGPKKKNVSSGKGGQMKLPPSRILDTDPLAWLFQFLNSPLPERITPDSVPQEPLQHPALTGDILTRGIAHISAQLVQLMNHGVELERKLKGQGQRRTKVLTAEVYKPVTMDIVRGEKWDMDDMRWCLVEGIKRLELTKRKNANFQKRLDKHEPSNIQKGKKRNTATHGRSASMDGLPVLPAIAALSDKAGSATSPSKKRGNPDTHILTPSPKKQKTPRTPSSALAGLNLDSSPNTRKPAKTGSVRKPAGTRRKPKVIDDDDDDFVC